MNIFKLILQGLCWPLNFSPRKKKSVDPPAETGIIAKNFQNEFLHLFPLFIKPENDFVLKRTQVNAKQNALQFSR